MDGNGGFRSEDRGWGVVVRQKWYFFCLIGVGKCE